MGLSIYDLNGENFEKAKYSTILVRFWESKILRKQNFEKAKLIVCYICWIENGWHMKQIVFCTIMLFWLFIGHMKYTRAVGLDKIHLLLDRVNESAW
jgi:hypothetical protein